MPDHRLLRTRSRFAEVTEVFTRRVGSVIDATQANIVVGIFRLYLDGHSLEAIAKKPDA
jgi:hypothetical protein